MKKTGARAGKKDAAGISKTPAIQQLQRAEAEVFALHHILDERSHEAIGARQAEILLRERLDGINDSLERQRSSTNDITADIARQYKLMQDQLLVRIEELEMKVASLSEQLVSKEVVIQQLRMEKEHAEVERERQLREQRKKMDDLAQEFADMLKETLEKMTSKIAADSGGI